MLLNSKHAILPVAVLAFAALARAQDAFGRGVNRRTQPFDSLGGN